MIHSILHVEFTSAWQSFSTAIMKHCHNLPLFTVLQPLAAVVPVMEQVIDISCPLGPQQQTC